jgi:hypothetical protein
MPSRRFSQEPVRDLRQVPMTAWARCREQVANFGAWSTRLPITGTYLGGLAAIPVGVTLWIGLIAGSVVAGAVLAVVAAVHVIIVFTVQGLARALIGVLREIDSAVLRAKSINGMICPWC